MEKVFEIVMLVVLAFGSAILFTLAMFWKFLQAVYQIIFTR